MRIIDGDAIEKDWYTELHSNYKDDYAKGFQAGLLTAIRYPTIEAEPVVHGEILWNDDVPHCSVCKKVIHGASAYCNHCGASMKGGIDHDSGKSN